VSSSLLIHHSTQRQKFSLDNLDTLFDSTLVAAQQPQWPGGPTGEPVANAVATLKKLPPLVFAGECDNLKEKIAEAAAGRAFWLQGGDCAETFTSATADSIRNRIKTILQMAAVLQYASSMPVIKVGRMAGQFAKPRSNDTETRDGVSCLLIVAMLLTTSSSLQKLANLTHNASFRSITPLLPH